MKVLRSIAPNLLRQSFRDLGMSSTQRAASEVASATSLASRLGGVFESSLVRAATRRSASQLAGQCRALSSFAIDSLDPYGMGRVKPQQGDCGIAGFGVHHGFIDYSYNYPSRGIM